MVTVDRQNNLIPLMLFIILFIVINNNELHIILKLDLKTLLSVITVQFIITTILYKLTLFYRLIIRHK